MKYIRFLGVCLIIFFPIQSNVKTQSLDFYGDVSHNYIIRWSFQKKSDFVYDMITNIWQWPTSKKGVSFNPRLVKPGNLVFARNAPEFFKKMHSRIKHPYILLTMGEWRESVKGKWLTFLDDDKIIAWFSVHACKKNHPKFYPIPIGLFQKKEIYKKRATLSALFARLRTQPKKKLLYSNHGDLFNKKADRKYLDAFMADKPWCTKAKKVQGLPFVGYMEEMAQFKFTLSPRGYGIDCYRTWEALMVGSIPIVRNSQLNCLYEGLPVLVIDKWEDLSEEFLNEKYNEIVSKRYDLAPLFCEYWLHKIKEVKDAYFDQR